MKRIAVLLALATMIIGGCGKPKAVPQGQTTVAVANEAIDYNDSVLEGKLKIKGLKAVSIDKDYSGIYCVRAVDRNHELYVVWFTRNNNLDAVCCGHGIKLYDKAYSIERKHDLASINYILGKR